MKVKKSLVKKPYKAFSGAILITTGYRSRGIYTVEILKRKRVRGEFGSGKRHMLCRIVKAVRDTCGIPEGELALMVFNHDMKEPIKKLIPLQ